EWPHSRPHHQSTKLAKLPHPDGNQAGPVRQLTRFSGAETLHKAEEPIVPTQEPGPWSCHKEQRQTPFAMSSLSHCSLRRPPEACTLPEMVKPSTEEVPAKQRFANP